MTVEAMLYRRRTGCPWRDLPQAFGCWNRIYKRFNAWSAAGKWTEIFKALVVEPDLEWAFIDGSYAKAHQHRLGLPVVRMKQSGKVGEATPARFIWQWMPLVFRLNLKSPGGKSMTARWHRS
jgi:hypothetical protein